MRLCHCHCRTRVACRSHIAFQDVLLLVLLAVVLAEINQMKNVHFPLGSVLFFYDDDDCFYIALFSALEQTHCARM